MNKGRVSSMDRVGCPQLHRYPSEGSRDWPRRYYQRNRIFSRNRWLRCEASELTNTTKRIHLTGSFHSVADIIDAARLCCYVFTFRL